MDIDKKLLDFPDSQQSVIVQVMKLSVDSSHHCIQFVLIHSDETAPTSVTSDLMFLRRTHSLAVDVLLMSLLSQTAPRCRDQPPLFHFLH